MIQNRACSQKEWAFCFNSHEFHESRIPSHACVPCLRRSGFAQAGVTTHSGVQARVTIHDDRATSEQLEGEGVNSPSLTEPPRCLQPLHLMEPDSTETNEWMD
jgi:hypothetical protein